jgi:hypothetical protein
MRNRIDVDETFVADRQRDGAAGLRSSRFAAFLAADEAFPAAHTEAEWRKLLRPD